MNSCLVLTKAPKVALKFALAAAVVLAPVAGTAADRLFRFEIGAGPRYAPTYEGSSDYKVGPTVGGSVQALSLGAVNIESGDGTGFSFGPSFRYLSARTAADAPILTGIADVDASLELGLKVAYRWQGAEVFAAARKGVIGHDGAVADLGANAVLRPDDQTTVRFGPRVSFADQRYMDTYFTVPGGATLPAYAAASGVKSAGLEVIARRDLSQAWAVEGTLGWNRLAGSAASSPIVLAGDRDQFSVGVLLIRKFDWRF
jgi:outer membrane protein